MILLPFTESEIIHLTIEDENFIYLCQKEYGGKILKICERSNLRSLRVLRPSLKLDDDRFITSDGIFNNEAEILEYYSTILMDQSGYVIKEEVFLVPGNIGNTFISEDHKQDILSYVRNISVLLF